MKKINRNRDNVVILTFILSLVFHLFLLSMKVRQPAAHTRVIHKVTLVKLPEPEKKKVKETPKKPPEPKKVVKPEPQKKVEKVKPPEMKVVEKTQPVIEPKPRPVVKNTPVKQEKLQPAPPKTENKIAEPVKTEVPLKEIGGKIETTPIVNNTESNGGNDTTPAPAEISPPAPKPVEPPQEVAIRETYKPAGGSVAPFYPESCRTRGEEGRVVIEVEILPNGSAGSIVVTGSSGYPALDSAAVNSARNSYFTPAKRNGVPVASYKRFVINFNLDDY
jgi:periplasmic protein TonB